MKEIKLTKGKIAIVDDEDFEWLNQWRWQFDISGYARRTQWISGGKGKTIKVYLHRLVMKNSISKRVDHMNGNKLDCRKSNLRLATHSENLMNRGLNINNKSGYKGVYFSKGKNKWTAAIKLNYKFKFLGYFLDKIDAAKAYNKAAKIYFGEFAYFNQIGGNIL